MAKEESFDIVSVVDLQEVDNAYGQASKELAQRYDLKGSGSSIEFDKKASSITISAPSDFIAGQVRDIVESKLVRRGVDLKGISWGKPQAASGGTVRMTGAIVQGIDQDIARKMSKDIKDQKFKCRTQIEGDKVRVFSQKRDTLQEVITFLKEQDYGVPLQYMNYR